MSDAIDSSIAIDTRDALNTRKDSTSDELTLIIGDILKHSKPESDYRENLLPVDLEIRDLLEWNITIHEPFQYDPSFPDGWFHYRIARELEEESASTELSHENDLPYDPEETQREINLTIEVIGKFMNSKKLLTDPTAGFIASSDPAIIALPPVSDRNIRMWINNEEKKVKNNRYVLKTLENNAVAQLKTLLNIIYIEFLGIDKNTSYQYYYQNPVREWMEKGFQPLFDQAGAALKKKGSADLVARLRAATIALIKNNIARGFYEIKQLSYFLEQEKKQQISKEYLTMLQLRKYLWGEDLQTATTNIWSALFPMPDHRKFSLSYEVNNFLLLENRLYIQYKGKINWGWNWGSALANNYHLYHTVVPFSIDVYAPIETTVNFSVKETIDATCLLGTEEFFVAQGSSGKQFRFQDARVTGATYRTNDVSFWLIFNRILNECNGNASEFFAHKKADTNMDVLQNACVNGHQLSKDHDNLFEGKTELKKDLIEAYKNFRTLYFHLKPIMSEIRKLESKIAKAYKDETKIYSHKSELEDFFGYTYSNLFDEFRRKIPHEVQKLISRYEPAIKRKVDRDHQLLFSFLNLHPAVTYLFKEFLKTKHFEKQFRKKLLEYNKFLRTYEKKLRGIQNDRTEARTDLENKKNETTYQSLFPLFSKFIEYAVAMRDQLSNHTLLSDKQFVNNGVSVVANYSDGKQTIQLYVRFLHFYDLSVKYDDKIKLNDELGKSGSNGYSTGPHVHFETYWKKPADSKWTQVPPGLFFPGQ